MSSNAMGRHLDEAIGRHFPYPSSACSWSAAQTVWTGIEKLRALVRADVNGGLPTRGADFERWESRFNVRRTRQSTWLPGWAPVAPARPYLALGMEFRRGRWH